MRQFLIKIRYFSPKRAQLIGQSENVLSAKARVGFGKLFFQIEKNPADSERSKIKPPSDVGEKFGEKFWHGQWRRALR